MRKLSLKFVKLMVLVSCVCCMWVMKTEAAEFVDGGYRQEESGKLELGKAYFDYTVDNRVQYYCFDTVDNPGVYVIHFSTQIEGGQSGASVGSATSDISLLDRYGAGLKSVSNTRNSSESRKRGTSLNDKNALVLSSMMAVDGLNANTTYYLKASAFDGLEGWNYKMITNFYVEFVPFLTASGFQLNYAGNGNLEFSWNNVQNYNTYSSLHSFDAFSIHFSNEAGTRSTSLVNGGVNKMVVEYNNASLLALGYPSRPVTATLVCYETFSSYYDETYRRTVGFEGSSYVTEVVRKGTEVLYKGLRYKVTMDYSNGAGSVAVIGVAKEKKNAKNITIPKEIKIKGYDFNVTSIGEKAFANRKKMKEVTIGAEITNIGKEAFSGCSKLTTVSIKSTKITKIGGNAFKNISKQGVIKVPKAMKKKYTKLLKGKYPKGVRIA